MKRILLLIAAMLCLAVPVLAEEDDASGEDLRSPYVSYWVQPATDKYPHLWFEEEINEDGTFTSVPTPPEYDGQIFKGWTVVANSQSHSYLLGVFDTITPGMKFDVPFAHPEYEFLYEYVIFLKYASITPEPGPVDESDDHSLYYAACIVCIIACVTFLFCFRMK